MWAKLCETEPRSVLLLCLTGEEKDADGDEEDGEPAAAVYVFVEEEAGGDGVADVVEGGDAGGGEGEIDEREGVKHGEEVEGHAEGPGEEGGVGDYGAGSSGEAGVGADEVEVADLAHGGGDEDFSGDGEEGDDGDAGPGDEGRGVVHQMAVLVAVRSVRAGVLATKPTAEVRRRMPSQRVGEMCSCSMKWLSRAMRTLPKAVAGMTKVRSAQDRAVM